MINHLYFREFLLNSFLHRLKRFNPQIWLPTLTLVWGIVSVFQGLVKNKAGLFGIRFCECFLSNGWFVLTFHGITVLGVTEAGLFPGVIYVFSVYYRRSERSRRVAVFFGGAALAGAFGGELWRFFCFQLIGACSRYSCICYWKDGRRGRSEGLGMACHTCSKYNSATNQNNRIFILEGVLTVVISLLAYFIVPTWPHKAKFVCPRGGRHFFILTQSLAHRIREEAPLGAFGCRF